MTVRRPGWLVTAATIVPLAVLSVAWTVDLTGLPVGTSASGPGGTPVVAKTASAALPDGTVVPSQPYAAPVSVSQPLRAARGPSLAATRAIVADAVASGIPAPALAAYQRAATVIDSADPTCNLNWELIAAIGRVESNHGRADGNVLTPQGIATPGIFGPVLDGSNHTARIPDTDGGQYDGNTKWDRAVGPMQFIPSTWAIVGVDGDGDGQRNPQDINDASLAAAIYLCSGTDNLSTQAGQSAAVFRYNHSQSYVATVLGVAAAYTSGNFTTPLGTPLPVDFLTRNVSAATTGSGAPNKVDLAIGPVPKGHRSHAGVGSVPATGHAGGAKNGPAVGAQPSGTVAPPSQQPSQPVKPGNPSTPPSTPPSTTPTTPPSSTPTTPPSTTPPSTTPPAQVPAWLTDLCTTQFDATWTASTTDVRQQAIDTCVTELNGLTEAQAQDQVEALVLALPDHPYDIVGLTPAPTPSPSTDPSTTGTASPSDSPSPSVP